MEIDTTPTANNNKAIKTGIERMIELGRELLQMSNRLEKKYANVNDEIIAQNRKMMEVCCLSLGNVLFLIEFDFYFNFIFRKHSVY